MKVFVTGGSGFSGIRGEAAAAAIARPAGAGCLVSVHRVVNAHAPPALVDAFDRRLTDLKERLRFYGSKAERELGLQYTPVRQAMQEAVEWYRSKPHARLL